MLFLIFCAIVNAVVAADNLIYYESLTGRTLTTEEYDDLAKQNLTFWCAGFHKECDPSEGRRMDLSCNNLLEPYRGTPHTPNSRDLPAVFGPNFEPIGTVSGLDPHTVRHQRMETFIDGSIPDNKFTILANYYMLFHGIASITSIHDTLNYVQWTTHCCTEAGKDDPACYPMTVDSSDTVHQFSNIRCMNMTRPFTYQSVGCVAKDTQPERINSASAFLDVSLMYGFDNRYRTLEGGRLKSEVDENGVVWPASFSVEAGREFCRQNHYPVETRCHLNVLSNGLMGSNVFSILMLRLHNHIADELAALNPCWDDDKLFFTTRDLIIALNNQFYYYELMPEFLGRKNLIKDGVIVPHGGYRDVYDENITPMVSTEYIYAMRHGHGMLPGFADLCDSEGNVVDRISTVNLTLRTGYFGLGDNFAKITQCSFRQPMAMSDHVIDPQVGEKGLGMLQRAFDLPAADLIKGGLMGIPPYVDYRTMCSGKEYSSFEDLLIHGDMRPEYVRILQGLYGDIRDIPLMVGIWLENMIPGGHAPRTMYCLLAKQLAKFPKYDRFWYESSTRPGAFDEYQLASVRRATMSWVLCTVGDTVTEIQRNAFVLAGPGHEMYSCEYHEPFNFWPWKDYSCDA